IRALQYCRWQPDLRMGGITSYNALPCPETPRKNSASQGYTRRQSLRVVRTAKAAMKKLFLTGIATLFLATAAHTYADNPEPLLLPSQEKANFFTVQICRDPRKVLGVIRSMAFHILKTTKVIIAHGVGPDWSGYEPDDVRLEGVLTNTNTVMVFC